MPSSLVVAVNTAIALLNEPNFEKGYEFVNGISGGVIPKEYIPAIDKGIQDALKSGVVAGFPVVDVKVTLDLGSYHEVDSSEQAFLHCWFHGD